MIKIFPRVTTSKDEFVSHIITTCEAFYVEEEKLEEWVTRVSNMVKCGNYFYGMIFVEKTSFLLISHELFHHLAELLRNITRKSIWNKIDEIIDSMDIAIFS